MLLRHVLHLASVAVLGALLLGCGGSDNDPVSAELRVIHASPDAGSVNVLRGGATVAGALTFPNAFPATGSAYAAVSAGTSTIEVRPAAGGAAVLTASPNLVGRSIYTAIAAGTAAPADTDPLQLILVSDSRASLPAGQAHLRVVHASTNASTVDVYITAPTVTSLVGITPTLDNVARYGVSNRISVAAGTYRIRVTPSDSQAIVVDTNVTLAANSYNVAVARNDAGTTTVSAYSSNL